MKKLFSKLNSRSLKEKRRISIAAFAAFALLAWFALDSYLNMFGSGSGSFILPFSDSFGTYYLIVPVLFFTLFGSAAIASLTIPSERSSLWNFKFLLISSIASSLFFVGLAIAGLWDLKYVLDDVVVGMVFLGSVIGLIMGILFIVFRFHLTIFWWSLGRWIKSHSDDVNKRLIISIIAFSISMILLLLTEHGEIVDDQFNKILIKNFSIFGLTVSSIFCIHFWFIPFIEDKGREIVHLTIPIIFGILAFFLLVLGGGITSFFGYLGLVVLVSIFYSIYWIGRKRKIFPYKKLK